MHLQASNVEVQVTLLLSYTELIQEVCQFLNVCYSLFLLLLLEVVGVPLPRVENFQVKISLRNHQFKNKISLDNIFPQKTNDVFELKVPQQIQLEFTFSRNQIKLVFHSQLLLEFRFPPLKSAASGCKVETSECDVVFLLTLK